MRKCTSERCQFMTEHMQLQIHFYQLDEASVILESTALGDMQVFGEVLLLNCLALRQMHHLGSAPASGALAHALVALGRPADEPEEAMSGDVPRIVEYPDTAGKKRFMATLDFSPQRARFLLHPKGFGILGRGVNYYAPQSVFVLFRHLTTVRAANDAYRRGLAEAASLCGQCFLEGKVTTSSQPTLALRIAERASAVETGSWKAHFRRAVALKDRGEVPNAIEEFKEVIRLSPDFYMAHHGLAEAYHDQGQLDDAIREYQEAIRLEPDDPDARVGLGIALRKSGLVEDAIVWYRDALRLSPDHAPAHNCLAIALHQSGQLDEAIREFRETLRLAPDYADAGHFHVPFGLALHEKGLLDEAIRAYEIALRMQPDNADVHRLLARALQGERLPRDEIW